MGTFKALHAGLPKTAVDLLSQACDQIYGAGNVSVMEVSVSALQAAANMNRANVVFLVAPEQYVSSDSGVTIPYVGDAKLVESLNARGASLEPPASTGGVKADTEALLALLAKGLGAGATTADFDELERVKAELATALKTSKTQVDEIRSLQVQNARLTKENLDLKRQQPTGDSGPRSVSFMLPRYANAVQSPTQFPSVALAVSQIDRAKVTFLFAGNDGTLGDMLYRSLTSYVLPKINAERVCVLDVNPESIATYKLGSRASSCADWLVNGVGNPPYALTKEKNLMLLVAAEGIAFTEGTLLNVDWNARLSQIIADGYHVVVVGGPLTHDIPRALYNALGGVSRPYIAATTMRFTQFYRLAFLTIPALQYRPKTVVLDVVHPQALRNAEGRPSAYQEFVKTVQVQTLGRPGKSTTAM